MSTSTIGHKAEHDDLTHLGTTRIQIKAILAATDFSDQATTALKVAAQMAKLFHSRLHVEHAVMPEFYIGDTTMLSSELQKIDVESSQQKLHQYTRKISEVRSIMHQEIALCGAPTKVIAALVETAGIDMVVMDRTAETQPGRWFWAQSQSR